MIRRSIAASILAFAVSAPAHAYLQNWYLDVDAGGAVAAQRVQDNIGIDGSSTGQVTLTPTSLTTFAFQETGAMLFTKPNQGGSTFFSAAGYEFTAVYTLTGSGTFGGSASFTGGTVDMYIQSTGAADYTFFGDTTADGVLYGSNDGIKIASFSVIGDSIGPLQLSGAPTNNAPFQVVGEATFMLPDYFFKDVTLTTDLADIVSSPEGLVLGFVVGNATLVDPADAATVDEFEGWTGQTVNYPDPDETTGVVSFIVNHGGQARLQVPEPGSLALTGLAMLGLGALRRRSKR